MVKLLTCFGAEEHRHKATLQLGIFLRGGDFSAGLGKVQQELLAQVGMCHLTTPETDADLNTVAVLEELLGTFDLGIEVVGVDAGAHPDLLDLHDLLILLGFLFTLLLIEAEFGIVHDLADRGDSIGRDLHKVKALLLRQLVGFVGRHNTQLGTVSTDQADLFIPDFFVELMI